MAGGRAGGEQFAERVNAAAELVVAGTPAGEAARAVAWRFGISERQARRYVDRAGRAGPAQVPTTKVVFTVKLPAELAGRVRVHAKTSGRTISALVAQALEEFLARARRERPRR